MGDERNLLETAYPGDIVALFNPGQLSYWQHPYTDKPVNFNVIPLFFSGTFHEGYIQRPL